MDHASTQHVSIGHQPFSFLALLDGLLLGRRRRQLTEREPDPSRLLRHDTRGASVEGKQSADNGEGTTGTVNPDGSRGVVGADELRNGEKEEGHAKAAQHEQDGNVGLQGGDEEDEGQQAPGDEVDAEGDGVGPVVPGVGLPDAQARNHEHGEG